MELFGGNHISPAIAWKLILNPIIMCTINIEKSLSLVPNEKVKRQVQNSYKQSYHIIIINDERSEEYQTMI